MHAYGYIPDRQDMRDYLYAAPPAVLGALPPHVDLRGNTPPVVDQGQLGSCTANAIAGALMFDELRQYDPHLAYPSRLFIYYNERSMEGTTGSDAGAMIRDGIKSVAQLGACPETPDWPYDIARFTDKPPATAYADGLHLRGVQYQRVTHTAAQMKGCLASGLPFVFGVTLYESFESPAVEQTGIVPMPRHGERVLGGHAMLCIGYDDDRGIYIVQNSWGTTFGDGGYVYMPAAYMEGHQVSDLWVIQKVQFPTT